MTFDQWTIVAILLAMLGISDTRDVLDLDREDELDMLDDIAFRARRSMENTEYNPLLGRVHTVADVVRFFEHQPKLPCLPQRDRSAS